MDTSFHLPYAYHFERYRNRAMIGLMLLAGLRRGEVINLKLNHVSLRENTIFIQQGKGKKDRYVPINAKLCMILHDYIKDRERLKKESIFFITQVQKDAPITCRAISNAVSRIRTRTKIYFSAHTLRHAFARLMIEGGCDIYSLSRIMGHEKITTTTIYLYCSNDQIHRSVEKHSLNL